MPEKRLLIISEYIAPVQAVASIRWTKYAKYLAKEHGYEITVVTNAKNFGAGHYGKRPYKYDKTLEDDLQWFETITIPDTFRQRFFNSLFSLGFHALSVVRGHLASKKSGADATGGASLENRASQALVKKNIPEVVYEAIESQCGLALAKAGVRARVNWDDYDVIISSYGPLWPHLLAKEIKRTHPSLFWIADFRDAIVKSERSDTKRNRELTRDITSAADAVFGVTDGVVERLFLSNRTKYRTVSNGYEREEIGIRRSDQDKFRFSYTGTLYADTDCQSDLTPLLKALAELIAEGSVSKEDVEVCYAGMSSYLFREMANHYHSVPTTDYGLLARSDALSLQAGSVALILACWNTRLMKSGRTAKIYEYMSRGLPIIALISGDVPHSDMRQFIEELNLGFCYEAADDSSFSELKAYVLKLYERWKKGDSLLESSSFSQGRERYFYGSLANDLDGYLSGLIRRRCLN